MKKQICTDIYSNTYTDTNTGNGAAPITSTADYVSKFCVVIDAGHGGSDGGIVSGLLSQTTPMQIFLSAFIATIMKMMRRQQVWNVITIVQTQRKAKHI